MPHTPASKPFTPATFLERGALVPFTSPTLTGARVRPTAVHGLEVLLPNPSGGKGVYVASWTDLRTLVRPTVHDIQLMERIASLRAITPTSIRQAARHIAAEGLAGRAAALAATSALAADKESLAMTRYQLQHRLLREEEPWTNDPPPNSELGAALFERRVIDVILAISPRLGQEPAVIAAHLAELAILYDPIGLDSRESVTRIPTILSLVRQLRQQALALASAAGDGSAMLAGVVASTAEATIAAVEQALADARSLTANMTELLRAQNADPASMARRLSRADWLIDGWERICQLWQLASQPAAQPDAMDEIAVLLSATAREPGDLRIPHLDTSPEMALRRTMSGREDWRTEQSVLDLIARNELLLAS